MLRLGYAKLADYGREVLGLAGRTAQAMARLSRELRARPVLAAAVRRGEVSPRKAEVVLGVALGRDEAEWVERARRCTVRELAADAGARGEPEAWERVVASASPETVARVEEAMELAGRLLGPTSQRWERLEVICQEFLGAHRGPGWDEPAAGRRGGGYLEGGAGAGDPEVGGAGPGRASAGAGGGRRARAAGHRRTAAGACGDAAALGRPGGTARTRGPGAGAVERPRLRELRALLHREVGTGGADGRAEGLAGGEAPADAAAAGGPAIRPDQLREGAHRGGSGGARIRWTGGSAVPRRPPASTCTGRRRATR